MTEAKAEAFSGKLLEILNGGMLSLMISVGHQTRLFDVMSEMQASTSAQIAFAAGLNERYVREWLGAMVTGRIIDYDPKDQKYFLPKEHAAFITRAAGIDNLALFAQYIPLLGNVEQEIVKCFKNGGGVPYSAYPRFQQLQAEETSRVFDARLVSQIIPLVGGLEEKLRSGMDVLDIGCGQGRAINLMAKAFPNSRFTGYDISAQGIEAARNEARNTGLANARFEVRNVAEIGEYKKYDFITAFDTIHDQAKPAAVLAEVCNALRDGGTFLMQDIAASSHLAENIANPLAPTLYTISTMHCMTVSLAYNGEGLGTVWGRQRAEQMLVEAGFSDIQVKEIPGDILNYYYISRKSP